MRQNVCREERNEEKNLKEAEAEGKDAEEAKHESGCTRPLHEMTAVTCQKQVATFGLLHRVRTTVSSQGWATRQNPTFLVTQLRQCGFFHPSLKH